jgi:hypothetical protein
MEYFFKETEIVLQNSRALATDPYLEISSIQLRDLLAYLNIKFNVIFPSASVSRKWFIPLTLSKKIFAASLFTFK